MLLKKRQTNSRLLNNNNRSRMWWRNLFKLLRQNKHQSRTVTYAKFLREKIKTFSDIEN